MATYHYFLAKYDLSIGRLDASADQMKYHISYCILSELSVMTKIMAQLSFKQMDLK